MKKDEFVVDKGPTPFKELCEEHEISYKDISLASGVAYHNLSKYALSVCKPSQETLAKLNQVCEPIFGKTLTLEDFGYRSADPEPVSEVSAGCTVPIVEEPFPEPAPAKKTRRKKRSQRKTKTTGKTKKKAKKDATATAVETQNSASLPVPEPEPAPVPAKPANDIRYARLKIECADNGFLLRDDVGNCWVADVSPDDLGKEIGREIYGEIDEAEKAIIGTDEWKLGSMTILGWSVVVAVKAITDPRELHEFKDREI